MPMRPTDLHSRLNRLADFAGTDQRLKRVLENIDVVAQEALDAESTYVTKKGDAVTVSAPQWAVVLNAQKLAAQLLGLDAEPGSSDKPSAAESPVDRIRRLAAVPSAPKATGGT